MTTSTSVHSNAFNFMSFLQSGVDPRTGQYTVAITLPDAKTNDLRGPGMPLALTYNPLNRLDTGFGLGWNLQLSQYTLGNKVLSLSTGETFKVTGSEGMQLVMKEKKIDSFHFYEADNDGLYRVVHKSGMVEMLKVFGNADNRVALPIQIYSPEGHKVTLDYVPFSGTHSILASIKDDSDQTLLTVKRLSSSVEVLLHPFSGPDGGPLARFNMTLASSSNYVEKITLPTDNQASWRFGYTLKNDQLCISSVETPTGAREEVLYEDQGHQFPDNSGQKPLPRVTGLRTHPGFGQPVIEVGYTYPGEKNFLGFGLGIAWDNDGLDNLYKYIGTYEYVCVETQVVAGITRTIERKFNQFHLLTSETTIQNNNVHKVETTYYLTPNVSFEQQPKYCQLPKDVKNTWSLKDNVTRQRSEIATSTYDTHGNLLTQTQPNGVVETSTWFPAADANDFVRHMKDQTVTPAASANGKAPTLITRYTYKTLPPLTGTKPVSWQTPEMVTQVERGTSGETELQRTVYTYTNQPGNAFLHGRIEQQTVTMKGKNSITAYSYEKVDSAELKESVLQTKETFTGFDHGTNGRNVIKETILQHSLLNGEPLLNRDDTNVEIRYTYDSLRRVTSETVSPNTDSAATRFYEYQLCATVGDQAEQRLFDVKNVKTCTKFDGLNRAVYEERDDADNVNPARAKEPRQVYAATYDPWGNLIKEAEFDWMAEDDWLENKRTLTSSFEYDDWGTQRCVTGPDGVKTFEETDPIGSDEWKGPIQRSWREGTVGTPLTSGVTETWLNLFEKPECTQRFDLNEKLVSLHQYFYDGLGRTAKEIVGFGDVKRETLYSYDAFDRMISSTLPGGAVVRRTYAEHSTEDLPITISVDNILLGEQAFDGLNRMHESVTGGRKQVFTFKPGETEPDTVTTPGGKVIEYDYQPQLGTEPVRRRLPRVDGILGEVDEAEYAYDLKNARLLTCQEQGLQLTREYYSTGELSSEKRVVADGEFTMNYQYSRLGRLLGYTDVLRQTQSYKFDAQGRLQETKLGTTVSTFTYDSLGQTTNILTSDSLSGQSVGTALKYDEFGRETERAFDLNGVKQTLTQVYNDVDGLKQRTLKEGTALLRDETYGYDLRGRLINYDCAGTQPPVDPYGKAITRQIFSFDALDNLKLVMTYFGGVFNRAMYSYDNAKDPAQLTKVTNNHADYPKQIDLVYNVDGHLISDEESRTLEYDALGRLIKVSGLPGEAPGSYQYDPLDTVAGVNSEGGQEHRFYQDGELANQIKGGTSSTFMRGDNVVLAERQDGAVPKS